MPQDIDRLDHGVLTLVILNIRSPKEEIGKYHRSLNDMIPSLLLPLDLFKYSLLAAAR